MAEAAMTIGLWTGFFWRLNKSIEKRVKRKNLVMKGRMKIIVNFFLEKLHVEYVSIPHRPPQFNTKNHPVQH